MSDFLSADEVAAKLDIKRDTVYKFARTGRIDVIVIGNKRKFTQEAVDKFLKEHTVTTEDFQQNKEHQKLVKIKEGEQSL
jgi:excisionase family DNA binding protein